MLTLDILAGETKQRRRGKVKGTPAGGKHPEAKDWVTLSSHTCRNTRIKPTVLQPYGGFHAESVGDAEEQDRLFATISGQ